MSYSKQSQAPTSTKEAADSPGVTLMPPTVFFVCLIIGGLLSWLSPLHLTLIPWSLNIFAGAAIGGSGLIFMCIAEKQFKKSGTNVRVNLPATKFVMTGAYKFSRNPMYVGGSFFYIGVGLLSGSVWMLASYIPLGLYLALYIVPREEAYMQRKFGEAYKTYCRNVRRWL